MAIAAVQCLNLAAGLAEKEQPTGYSKFANKMTATMPSRHGMMLIYTPALVTSCAVAVTAPAVNGREALVASLLVAHFGKRCLEVLFLHRYSGTLEGKMAFFISIMYSLMSLLVGVQTQHVPAALYSEPVSQVALPVGLFMFAVGQIGNLYHHYLLANMRPSASAGIAAVASTPKTSDMIQQSSAKPPPTPSLPAYTIPSGGLFNLVTMPHYTFEVVAWLGVALVSQQLNSLLVAAGMASYLAGRAAASTSWYRKKFGDAYPAGRRHILPFIF